MRLGILGGTFNPPHFGHLALAQAARKEMALDRVLLMVAADPPHKPVELPAQARYEMTLLAVSGQEGLEASDLELQRLGKSYTVDTLRTLHEQYSGAELFLIVGEDMLNDLPGWWKVEEIFKLASIIGTSRPGTEGSTRDAAARLTDGFGAKVYVTDFSGPELSSTEIRERIYAGRPVEGMLPEPVERLIYEKGYYFPKKIRSMQEKLASVLKRKRYEHIMGVVRTTAALCERFGEDPQRARLAALLHDCAKLGAEEMPALAVELGYVPDAFETESPGLMHGQLGALLAERDYGIMDPEILNAIRYHTTGRRGMSRLEKIIAMADMTEPGRGFPGVEELRILSTQDLDAAMRERLIRSRDVVKRNGQVFHPRSLEALESLC